jgi:hypothetical protein
LGCLHSEPNWDFGSSFPSSLVALSTGPARHSARIAPEKLLSLLELSWNEEKSLKAELIDSLDRLTGISFLVYLKPELIL